MTDKAQETQVDLVIIIDTSPSMRDEAVALSEATEIAIEAVKANCPSDLRVSWFGIEGTWRNSHFNRTIRDYLVTECQVAESKLRGRHRGTVTSGGAQEDGARAIEDIANYFDWRAGATRAIFYLGDEALEGGGEEVDPEDIAAANLAIQTAKDNQVMVHTYLGTSASKSRQELQNEYARVAHETSGQAFTEQDVISNSFAEVLKQVICATTNPGKPVEPVCSENTQEMKVCVCGTNGASWLSTYTETTKQQIESRVIRASQAHQLVKRYALASLATGIIPIPLVDMAALLGIQLKMLYDLAKQYEVPFSHNIVSSLVGAVLGSFIPTATVTNPISTSLSKGLPLFGQISGIIGIAAVGGASTYAVGKIFIEHFESGGTFLNFNPDKMRAHFRELYEEGIQLVVKPQQ